MKKRYGLRDFTAALTLGGWVIFLVVVSAMPYWLCGIYPLVIFMWLYCAMPGSWLAAVLLTGAFVHGLILRDWYRYRHVQSIYDVYDPLR